MKRILASLLLATAATIALAAPTAAELQAYTTRAQLYMSMGQSLDAATVSLRNYFGRSWFNTQGGVNIVYGSPTDVPTIVLSTGPNVQPWIDRAALYISMGQTPSQVAASLNSYFGRSSFVTTSNGWSLITDVIYQEGSGNGITFMVTVATMPTKN